MLHIFYKDYALLNIVISEAPIEYKRYQVRLNIHLFMRIIRKILGRNIVYFPFLSHKMFVPVIYEEVKQVKPGDSVLLLEMILPSEVWAMAKLLPKDCKLYQWYWNPLYKIYREKDIAPNILFTKKMGFRIYTFDNEDAERYGLEWHNQFSIRLYLKGIFSVKYDFYFLGRIKDRSDDIKEIKDILCSFEYKLKFIVLSDTDTPISYEENIMYVLDSKCIVDIIQKQQSGITMRAVEALLYKKKLLTNNVNIEKCDFYNPDNIFIYGKDSIDNFYRFLSAPYKDIGEDIVSKYTVAGWLKTFE